MLLDCGTQAKARDVSKRPIQVAQQWTAEWVCGDKVHPPAPPRNCFCPLGAFIKPGARAVGQLHAFSQETERPASVVLAKHQRFLLCASPLIEDAIQLVSSSMR